MNSPDCNVFELDRRLNTLLLAGRVLDAFDQFYSDDISMQENCLPVTEGKPANRTRIERFFQSIQEIHRIELVACACSGNVTFSEWIYEVTPLGSGRRITCQVAVRHWAEGRVRYERFYYSLR